MDQASGMAVAEDFFHLRGCYDPISDKHMQVDIGTVEQNQVFTVRFLAAIERALAYAWPYGETGRFGTSVRSI